MLPDSLKILVENGAQVNLDDERSILEFYEYLDRDQEVQQKITLRESPLMKAVQSRDEELVAYLIEAGADMNYVGENSIDALGLCTVDNGKIFTMLLYISTFTKNCQVISWWTHSQQSSSTAVGESCAQLCTKRCNWTH